MKVGIILYPYGEKKSAGLAEYIFELTKNLIANDRVNEYLVFLRGKPERLPQFSGDNWRVVPLGLGRWWRELGLFFAHLRLSFGGQAPDLYIFNTPVMPLFFKPKKSVVIALDFAYLYFQPKNWREWVINGILFWINRFSMKRADLVVAISEATKQDVIKFFGIDEKKIKVIYPGFRNLSSLPTQDPTVDEPPAFANLHYADSSGKARASAGKYFLFVGVIKERKNVFNVVSAFIELKKKYNLPHKLVIAGKGGGLYLNKINELIGKEKMREEIIFTGYVSDEQLVGLYGNAEALVFPSLVEGFGFPILEAMSVGVPVITSKTSSLGEVAGGAALLVDPHSISEIAEAMRKIASDENLRKDLINRGLERTKHFSWQKTAGEFLKEIDSLARF